MTQTAAARHASHERAHSQSVERTLFGFWVYLMTDCMLFGTLFAAFIVLRNNTFGGPSGKELFEMKGVIAETLCLLVSSFTSGIAMPDALGTTKRKVIGWFAATFVLGAAFLALELTEFSAFIREGNSWERNASLSAFFTLVGTHGLHITIGLFFMLFLMFQVHFSGLTPAVLKRLTCLRLFWHFLDLVWIFIFTIVYLMGVI